GIRDRNVTGVQTCALPISLRRLRDRCRVDVDDLLGRLLLVLHVVDQVLEGVAGLLAGELVDGGVQLPLLHVLEGVRSGIEADGQDRKSTRLNSSHVSISYA